MVDDKSLAPEERIWQRYRLATFLVLAMIIGAVLVAAAMALYDASGTALLDLSRPGYQEQRRQVAESKSLQAFEPTGELDDEAIRYFRELYKNQAERAAEWAFSGDSVLSDKELGISDPEKD